MLKPPTTQNSQKKNKKKQQMAKVLDLIWTPEQSSIAKAKILCTLKSLAPINQSRGIGT